MRHICSITAQPQPPYTLRLLKEMTMKKYSDLNIPPPEIGHVIIQNGIRREDVRRNHGNCWWITSNSF